MKYFLISLLVLISVSGCSKEEDSKKTSEVDTPKTIFKSKNFVEIGRMTTGDTWYYDADSVENTDGNALIWILKDRKNPVIMNTEKVFSEISLYQINCTNDTFRIANIIPYAGNLTKGKRFEVSSNPNGNFFPIEQDGVIEIKKISCK